jgi:G3E family GTPase
MNPRTPLVVIGGFLGAGKTTLLNRLLAQSRGRIAVLVNDFGAINVDAGLIADHDGKTMRLTNGCVCCSLADGFLDTMMRVLAEPFDRVVVEASGVGDPAAIAEIALVEPSLVLGAVLVLADAERLAGQLADARIGDTVRRQISAADIVILNKLDLVDDDGLRTARAAIEAVRPGARIVGAIGADVPLAILADVEPTPRSRFRAAADHEGVFARFLYRRDGAFARGALAEGLAAMPPSLLRLKGIVMLSGERPHLLQMVGPRWTLAPASGEKIALTGLGTADCDLAEIERRLDRALA